MITALLIKIGLTAAGAIIGWAAKKWHLQPYLNYLQDNVSSAALVAAPAVVSRGIPGSEMPTPQVDSKKP